MTPSCQRIATKPGAARVHVRLSVPVLLSLLCCSIQSSSRYFNKVAAHECRFRGLCKCSLHATTRLQCLVLHLPYWFMIHVACRFLLRKYSTGPSSGDGGSLMMELTIFRCTVSTCICRNEVGGHLVSRPCMIGRTARSMRVNRRFACNFRATLLPQLPK